MTSGNRTEERQMEREIEDRQGGGANIRKPQLLCVRGTHPWCTLKARHYRGSQMIALLKTTGWAARLQPPQTTWLGTNSRQDKKCPSYGCFSCPSFLRLTEGTFLSKQLVRTCSQSVPSLFQQVKADMPAGQVQEYVRYVHCCTDQLTIKQKSTI